MISRPRTTFVADRLASRYAFIPVRRRHVLTRPRERATASAPRETFVLKTPKSASN